jgi:hypothetical protein
MAGGIEHELGDPSNDSLAAEHRWRKTAMIVSRQERVDDDTTLRRSPRRLVGSSAATGYASTTPVCRHLYCEKINAVYGPMLISAAKSHSSWPGEFAKMLKAGWSLKTSL